VARASKVYQIQAYFEALGDHTQALSEGLMVVNARRRFFCATPTAIPVKQVLKAKAQATPGILIAPEVEAKTVKHEDSGISYRVSFYIDSYQDRLKIRDEYQQAQIWHKNQGYNQLVPHSIRFIMRIEAPN
jgi:hypothetical protein